MLKTVAVFILCLSGIVKAGEPLHLGEQCYRCLCEMMTSCNTEAYCTGDICGPYAITYAYWEDAGGLTVNTKGSYQNHRDAWIHCSRDTLCAQATIRSYMSKFGQDCNGDAIINCRDYALIHKYGGYGCKGQHLDDVLGRRFDECYHTLPHTSV